MGGPDPDPRRRAERHNSDVVTCDLGNIVNLSAGGVRITGKGKLPFRAGQTGRLRLAAAGGALTLTAQTVWVKRKGLRGYDMGLRFIDLKPGMGRIIESMAKFGFFSRDTGADENSSGKFGRAKVQATFQVPDHYGTLGVDESASGDEIQLAYRRLAMKYHPDVCREPDAHRRFSEIAEAYEVLRDPDRRRMFDMKAAS